MSSKSASKQSKPGDAPVVSTQTSYWMLFVILIGQALAAMDTAIVNVAAPTLQRELDLSGAMLQLTVAGYGLAYASFLITAARLGALYGYRRLFVIGLAVFTVSSTVCGMAASPQILVSGRVFQGFGAALLVPQVLSLIQLSYSGTAKSRAIGLYSMILGLGAAAGQILGGVIVSMDVFLLSWRPAFLINIPVGLLLILLAFVLLPSDAGKQKVKLDLVGVIAGIAAALSILVPLTFGRELDWPLWSMLLAMAGIVILAGFWRYEKALSQRGKSPILDPELLAIRGIPQGLGVIALGFIGYGGWLLTVALYLQTGLGFSALVSGLTFGAYAIGFGSSNLFWSYLPERLIKHAPALAMLTLLCASVFFALLVTGQGWHPVAGPLLLFFAGSGHGMSFGTTVNRMTSAIPEQYASSLSGLATSCSQFSVVSGTAILGSVYFAVASGFMSVSGGSNTAMVAVALTVAICAAFGFVLAGRLPLFQETPKLKVARQSDG